MSRSTYHIMQPGQRSVRCTDNLTPVFLDHNTIPVVHIFEQQCTACAIMQVLEVLVLCLMGHL